MEQEATDEHALERADSGRSLADDDVDHIETPPCDEVPQPYLQFQFDGDDVVVDFVEKVIDSSVCQSLESFYSARLLSFVALSAVEAVFEVVTPVLATRGLNAAEYDPVEGLLARPQSEHAAPSRTKLDNFAQGLIPVRTRRKVSQGHYGSPSRGTPSRYTAAERSESPSRPASLYSSKHHKRKSTLHADPRAAVGVIPPGVVFSTAPSRNLMELVKRVSALTLANKQSTRALERGNTSQAQEQTNNEENMDLQDTESPRRRSRRLQLPLDQGSSDGRQHVGADPSSPVKVAFTVQRISPDQATSVRVLPELRAITAAATAKPQIGGQFADDPTMQHFQSMALSPGVKMQAGDTSKAGPDLPLFASRMRKSTFFHVDALSLSAAASNQSLSLASQLSGAGHDDRSRHCALDLTDGKESSICQAEAPCQVAHSTASLFVKRPSRVFRPCASAHDHRHHHHHGDDASATHADKDNSVRDLIKQRAFQRKSSTVVSPTKKPPSSQSRRPTTAFAVTSPLARRKMTVKAATDDSEALHKIL